MKENAILLSIINKNGVKKLHLLFGFGKWRIDGMKEIAAIAIRKAVFENAEIAIKRCWLSFFRMFFCVPICS